MCKLDYVQYCLCKYIINWNTTYTKGAIHSYATESSSCYWWDYRSLRTRVRAIHLHTPAQMTYDIIVTRWEYVTHGSILLRSPGLDVGMHRLELVICLARISSCVSPPAFVSHSSCRKVHVFRIRTLIPIVNYPTVGRMYPSYSLEPCHVLVVSVLEPISILPLSFIFFDCSKVLVVVVAVVVVAGHTSEIFKTFYSFDFFSPITNRTVWSCLGSRLPVGPF